LDFFVETYAPTLKKIKGNWYISVTVPEELRGQLGGQLCRSTGASDKNEAKKSYPRSRYKLRWKLVSYSRRSFRYCAEISGNYGSSVYSATTAYLGVKILKAGLFKDLDRLKVVTNIWCDSAPLWGHIDKSIPSH